MKGKISNKCSRPIIKSKLNIVENTTFKTVETKLSSLSVC